MIKVEFSTHKWTIFKRAGYSSGPRDAIRDIISCKILNRRNKNHVLVYMSFKYSRASRKRPRDMLRLARWSLTGGGRLPEVRPQGPIFRVICIWWPHPLVSSYRNLCNNFKQLVQGKKLESMATVLYLTCYIIQRLGQFTWKNLGSFVSLEADTGKIEFRSIIATEKVWHLIQVKRPPDQFEVVRRVELWYVFQKQGFFVMRSTFQLHVGFFLRELW